MTFENGTKYKNLPEPISNWQERWRANRESLHEKAAPPRKRRLDWQSGDPHQKHLVRPEFRSLFQLPFPALALVPFAFQALPLSHNLMQMKRSHRVSEEVLQIELL